MEYKNLILGIILLFFGFGLLYYDNDKDNSGMLKAINSKLKILRIGMIIIGLYIICRELI